VSSVVLDREASLVDCLHHDGTDRLSEERRQSVPEVVRPRPARGRRALCVASESVSGAAVRRLFLVQHAASDAAVHPTRSGRRQSVALAAAPAAAAQIMI